MDKKHIGSDFEDFLKEEGIYEEVTLAALKEVIAYELAQAMKSANVTQEEMAARIGTSRSVIRRLLDPDNYSVTLITLHRVAKALGKDLEIKFSWKM